MSLLQVGDKIDNYRIECCLGVGGMGEVYLATHQILNVQRALKIPYPDLLERDPLFRERLTREGHIAAHFQHPNSIEVVNVETESDSGFLYLVMEYVDGRTLREYLNEGVLDEKQTLLICREIACALDAAWQEMRLVHRDIKPANIMIASDGTVKLADLGVAKALPGENESVQTLTMEGALVGTPDYAAPEQLIDASKVDTRADIYSIGATMYTMLTGVRPFFGADTFETLRKVLHEPLKPVREWNPGVSAEIAALVERMMSKDPANRPQTMRELVEIYNSMLADQSPVPEVREVPQPVDCKKTVLLAAPEMKTKPPRNCLIEIFCCILFVTVIILAFEYTMSKTVYAKKGRFVFLAESEKLAKAERRKSFPSYSKNGSRRYTYGVHYSHDGTCLTDVAVNNDSLNNLSILETAKNFQPNAFRNCDKISIITLPAAMLPDFAARIHEFPNLRDITVYCFDDEPMPDVKLPSHIYLRKQNIIRRKINIAAKKPEVKPVPEKETPLLKTVLGTVTKPLPVKMDDDAAAVVPQKTMPGVPDVDSPAYTEARKAGLEFSPDGRILKKVTDPYIRKCQIPEGVEIVGSKAFENCKYLEAVVLPSTAKGIDSFAFRNCSMLQSVHLPAGLKRIEHGAFQNCQSLEQIELPEMLTFLGESFRDTSVKKLNISKHVRYITGTIADTGILKISPENPYLKMDRYGVLYRIENKQATLLTARSNKLPRNHYSVIRGTVAIGNDAFSGVVVSRVTLPDSVIWIGHNAFSGCMQLQKVDMPSGLQTIFSSAFSECPELTIEIPAGVKEIGASAFRKVKQVTVAKGNRFFLKDRAGALYDKKARKLIYYPSRSLMPFYTALRGTEVIGYHAFFDCQNLQGVILPEGLKKIETQAFRICPKLQQVNIPSSVERIESYAFDWCSKLKKVIVPTTTKISSNSFDYSVTVQRKP